MEPMKSISWVWQIIFAMYVVFCVVGVLNVLTGVFMESALNYQDRDIAVQDEIDRLDSFVTEMMALYQEFNPGHGEFIEWETFHAYLQEERVEAYLSSHMLETTHARMLFKMLDVDGNNKISIYEFVVGMLRLKGAAKTYDTRVLLREITHLKDLLKQIQFRADCYQVVPVAQEGRA